MGTAEGVSDQSYMSLGYKPSCKGDSSQCFEGRRTVVHKEVNTKVFIKQKWQEIFAWRWGQENHDSLCRSEDICPENKG